MCVQMCEFRIMMEADISVVWCEGSRVFFKIIIIIINIDNTIKYCQEYFDFSLPSVLWAKRIAKFEVSFKWFLSVL